MVAFAGIFAVLAVVVMRMAQGQAARRAKPARPPIDSNAAVVEIPAASVGICQPAPLVLSGTPFNETEDEDMPDIDVDVCGCVSSDQPGRGL